MTDEVIKRGVVLASNEESKEEWLYRGDVVAGEKQDEHILVFSRRRRAQAGGRWEHFPLDSMPDDVRCNICQRLKSWKARLPERTLEAKEYLKLAHGDDIIVDKSTRLPATLAVSSGPAIS